MNEEVLTRRVSQRYKPEETAKKSEEWFLPGGQEEWIEMGQGSALGLSFLVLFGVEIVHVLLRKEKSTLKHLVRTPAWRPGFWLEVCHQLTV